MLNFIEKIKFDSTLKLIFFLAIIPHIHFSYYDHHIYYPHLCTHIYWSHNPVTNIFDLTFEATLPSLNITSISSWVAWGINPITKSSSGTHLIVISRLPNRKLGMKMYNLTYSEAGMSMDETQTFLGDTLEFESDYRIGYITFTAKISLIDKSELFTNIVMIGDGREVFNTNLKSLGFLHLSQTKSSFLSRQVDAYTRAFSFEKQCTVGKKSTWTDYITWNNMRVVQIYAGLMIILCCIELEEEEPRWVYKMKLLCVSIALISTAIMQMLLMVKENEFDFYLWFFFCFLCNVLYHRFELDVKVRMIDHPIAYLIEMIDEQFLWIRWVCLFFWFFDEFDF